MIEEIKIPKNIKRIRFDIGLSYCAPNSAVWLNSDKDNDLFIIGIEPNKYCLSEIKQNGIYCRQHNIKPIKINNHNNFLLLDFAFDDVDKPLLKDFYYTDFDPGTSSLLKPTTFLGNSIKEIEKVTCVPFSEILKKIDYERFQFIELVKIDTQGKDLDIIKSAKSFLDKIVFLNCETNTFNHYENNTKPIEIEDYLNNKGFIKLFDNSYVNNEVVDSTFINIKYLHLKDKINYYVL